MMHTGPNAMSAASMAEAVESPWFEHLKIEIVGMPSPVHIEVVFLQKCVALMKRVR
jgi:hypothetical protein